MVFLLIAFSTTSSLIICVKLDENEILIVQANGLVPIVQGVAFAAEELENLSNKSDRELAQIEELATQCSRALSNLSVNPENKAMILKLQAVKFLHILLSNNPNERIVQQARRALKNLESTPSMK